MNNTENIEKEQPMISEHEKDLQRLANFRLMDDDFFSEALDGKNEAVEYLLCTILERTDLKVINTAAQVEYKSATKRSIKLDIKAVDAEKKVIDIEIQRSDRGSGIKRARFHSSMIDRTLLDKGNEFDDLVDTYVIFITENDKFGRGIPMYHVDRRIQEMDYALFGDGTHIIYVNGEYQDTNHPVGCLMHDFNCKDADDILNPLLAKEVRYLKETEGGQNQMCKAMEEMRNEAAAQATYDKAIETAAKLLAIGKLTNEEIADSTGLDVAVVKELAQTQPV